MNMKKETIELPIEWIEVLDVYIENVKKTDTLEDVWNSHRLAVTALLGYLESLKIYGKKMIRHKINNFGCPQCEEEFIGNGSIANPYQCSCGNWQWDSDEFNYILLTNKEKIKCSGK